MNESDKLVDNYCKNGARIEYERNLQNIGHWETVFWSKFITLPVGEDYSYLSLSFI
jgi:hypothetical protein